MPGQFLPWNLLLFARSPVLWVCATPAKETLAVYDWRWIAYLPARNATIGFVLGGALELRLYVKRAHLQRPTAPGGIGSLSDLRVAPRPARALSHGPGVCLIDPSAKLERLLIQVLLQRFAAPPGASPQYHMSAIDSLRRVMKSSSASSVDGSRAGAS